MQLDISTNPRAAQIFKLLKERRVSSWSFAYDVIRDQRADDGADELLEVDLIEVGPTLKGANSQTHTITAKSHTTSNSGTYNVVTNVPIYSRVIDNAEAEHRRREALKATPQYWNKKLDELVAGKQPAKPTSLADDLYVAEQMRAINRVLRRGEQDRYNESIADRARVMADGSLDDAEAEALARENELREQAAADRDREQREREMAERAREEYLRSRANGDGEVWTYAP